MIRLNPDRPKTLTFNVTFRGMDLSRAKTRMLLPVREGLMVVAEGRIHDDKIIVKVPALGENVPESRQAKAVLEIITKDNHYFSPYETQVVVAEEARIDSVTVKEEEDQAAPEKKKVVVRSIDEEEGKPIVKKESSTHHPKPKKADSPKSRLAKFLEG